MKNTTFHLPTFKTFVILLAMLISFLSVSKSVFAQTTCCQRNCNNGDPVIWVCDYYPDTYGPFYVKVYLYFVEPPNEPDAFEDPLEDRSAEIWGKWQDAYSPHRIHFVPGFGGCDPAGNFEVISSAVDEADMNDVETLRSLGYKNDDGIDVYIFRDDTPLVGGSFCTPNNYFFLGGTDISFGTASVASKTQLVSHELGHCLGLPHTNEDTVSGCIRY